MMKIWAKKAFRQALTNGLDSPRDRVEAWRDLSIAVAPELNPFQTGTSEWNAPIHLEKEYFPTGRARAIGSLGEVGIDPLDDLTDEGLQTLLDSLDLASGSIRSPWKWVSTYTHAGHAAVRRGQPMIALRCFLNVNRLGHLDESVDVRSDVAYCLALGGAFRRAGDMYAEIGHAMEATDSWAAADAYQRAGLAWEAMRKTDTRPMLEVAGSRINSSSAFLRAKSLFSSIGDYDEASRCFVLEREAQRRWTWSVWRRGSLATMRRVWLYGESPFHVVRFITMVLLLFAIAFPFVGIEADGRTIHYPSTWGGWGQAVHDFGDSLYFSAVALTTLGDVRFAPVNLGTKILAVGEAFLGLVSLAMIVIALERRFVGR